MASNICWTWHFKLSASNFHIYIERERDVLCTVVFLFCFVSSSKASYFTAHSVYNWYTEVFTNTPHSTLLRTIIYYMHGCKNLYIYIHNLLYHQKFCHSFCLSCLFSSVTCGAIFIACSCTVHLGFSCLFFWIMFVAIFSFYVETKT